jgi:hypothetical protein
MARLVVYDSLFLDTAAQERFRNPLSAEALRIAPLEFEPRVYTDAAVTTLGSLSALTKSGVNIHRELDIDNFFFGDLKSYTDQISRGFHGLGVPSRIAIDQFLA